MEIAIWPGEAIWLLAGAQKYHKIHEVLASGVLNVGGTSGIPATGPSSTLVRLEMLPPTSAS